MISRAFRDPFAPGQDSDANSRGMSDPLFVELCFVLAAMGPEAEVATLTLTPLCAPNKPFETVPVAAFALARIGGADAQRAVPALRASLKRQLQLHQDEPDSGHLRDGSVAALSLLRLAPEDPENREIVLRILAIDRNFISREEVESAPQPSFVAVFLCESLAELGSDAAPYISVLEGLATDERPKVRRAAAYALSRIRKSGRPHASSAVSAGRTPSTEPDSDGEELLIRALQDDSPSVRERAARQLGKGPRSSPVISALLEHWDDPDPAARAAVRAALHHLYFDRQHPMREN